MKKLLVFHNQNDYTGSTRALETVLSENYIEYKIRIITIRGEGFLGERDNIRYTYIWCPLFRGKNIPVISFSVSRLSFIFAALVSCIFYPLVYVNTLTMAPQALVARLYRRRVLFHVHEKYTVRTAESSIYEWIFNHIKTERLFVSKYLESTYPKKDGCISTVRYNKLSKEFCDKVSVVPFEKRGLNTVTMLTSLTVIKGIPMFVELAWSMPDLKFRLILSADKIEADTFFRESMPENLEVVIKPKSVHDYYRKTDVVVNLTDPRYCIESFGLTLIEANAYGIPVVAPNVGGPMEIVEDGSNGYCVDVTDRKVIEDAIRKILVPEKYYEMLNSSFLKARNFF